VEGGALPAHPTQHPSRRQSAHVRLRYALMVQTVSSRTMPRYCVRPMRDIRTPYGCHIHAMLKTLPRAQHI